MVKLVGYERKFGEFNVSGSNDVINYDNHIIYILDNSDANVFGSRCEQVKIRTRDLEKLFGTNNLEKFLDENIELNYNVVSGKPVLSNVKILDSDTDFKFSV